MRIGLLFALALAVGLAGCATSSYEIAPDSEIHTGPGGYEKTVDGIEFWLSGAPEKPFQTVGTINSSEFDFSTEKQPSEAVLHKLAGIAKKMNASGIVFFDQDTSKFTTISQPIYPADKNDKTTALTFPRDSTTKDGVAEYPDKEPAKSEGLALTNHAYKHKIVAVPFRYVTPPQK